MVWKTRGIRLGEKQNKITYGKCNGVWMLQLVPSAGCSVSHSRFQLSWIISTNSMRKQKLKRRYSRKRSGPRGRRLSEVCVIDENDTWIVDTILRHFPGIFQNIHDSFDEIDSKTLNNVYRKSTQQPARDKSGEPLTTICHDPWCDTKHCHQDPASGRRTPPGPSPAPPWQRRWV